MQKRLKIVLTGGHAATAALGVVEEISKRKLDLELFWVGPVSAMETRSVETAASKIFAKYDVKVIKIIAGRALRRGSFIAKIRAYVKIPVGFIDAFLKVGKINPDIVISFGGFAALPVVFVGFLLGKKIFIQEQVAGAGLANKLSAPFAKKIFVARHESLEFFPKNKTLLIGNPQVSEFFGVKMKNKMGNPATVFITGGSSGAVTINDVVDKILDKLLFKFYVIHQTGENNLEYFVKRKEKMDEKFKKRYEVFGYISPEKFVACFERADIIISRAGANTVADILNCNRPAILIPIPWSIGDEQTKNAMKAVDAGLGVIIKQDDLTPEILMEKIEMVIKNWERMVKNVKHGDWELDKFAAKRMVDEIFALE